MCRIRWRKPCRRHRLFEESITNEDWGRITEAVFVAACKEGRKPESAQVKSAVKDWFEWARRERIVIAMSGEVVYTPDGEAVELQEMMRRFGVQK